MSTITCSHPECGTRLTRQNTILCGPHHSHLSKSLKQEMKFAVSQGGVSLEDFQAELQTYFSDRQIGDLEIACCRYCDEDIVWFVSGRGKPYPVNAENVEEGDEKFVSGRHVFHSTTCEARQNG